MEKENEPKQPEHSEKEKGCCGGNDRGCGCGGGSDSGCCSARCFCGGYRGRCRCGKLLAAVLIFIVGIGVGCLFGHCKKSGGGCMTKSSYQHTSCPMHETMPLSGSAPSTTK